MLACFMECSSVRDALAALMLVGVLATTGGHEGHAVGQTGPGRTDGRSSPLVLNQSTLIVRERHRRGLAW